MKTVNITKFMPVTFIKKSGTRPEGLIALVNVAILFTSISIDPMFKIICDAVYNPWELHVPNLISIIMEKLLCV